MKPIKLLINGINSFEKEQIIDFEYLTKSSIFGIFGETGSGKTTVIDSIILALYNKMPRHGGKKCKSIINTEKKEGSIEFTFSTLEGKNEEVYTVYRKYKIKNNNSIETNKSTLVHNEEVKSEKEKDVTKAIENIIGLNYEDFTKAVILPQGKFSEFLNMKNSDKGKMLERILKLEKYGDFYTNKIKERKNKIEKSLSEIETKKEGLIYANDNRIKELKKINENIERRKKNIEIEINKTREKINKLEKDLGKAIKLEEYNKIKIKVEKDKEKYTSFNKKLELGTRANSLRQNISIIQTNEEKLKNLQKEKIDDKVIEENKKTIELAENSLEELIKTSKETEKKNNDSINKLIPLLELIDSISKLDVEIKEKEENINSLEKKKKEYQINKNKKKEDIEYENEKQGKNTLIISEKLNKYLLNDDEIKEIKEVSIKENDIKRKLEEFNELKKEENKYEFETKSISNKIHLSKKNDYEFVLSKINYEKKLYIEKEIKTLENKIKNEKIEEKLKLEKENELKIDIDLLEIDFETNKNLKLVKDLRKKIELNGKCDVCGSSNLSGTEIKISVDDKIEHRLKSKKILLTETEKEKNALKTSIGILEEKLKELKNKEKMVLHIDRKQEDKVTDLAQKKVDAIMKNIKSIESYDKYTHIYDEKLKKELSENSILIGNLSAQEMQLKDIKNNLKNKKNEGEKLRKEIDCIRSKYKISESLTEYISLLENNKIEINKKEKENSDIEKIKSNLEKERNEIHILIISIENEINKLKEYIVKDKKEMKEISEKIKGFNTKKEVTNQINILENNNNKLMDDEKLKRNNIAEMQKKINDLIRSKDKNETQYKEVSNTLETILKNVEDECVKIGILNYEEVKNYYLEDNEKLTLKKYIKEYEKDLAILNSKKSEVEAFEVENSKNDLEEILEVTKVAIEEKEKELVIILEDTGKNREKLKRTLDDNKKMKELEILEHKESKKEDVIKKMENIFKGNAFVNFIAMRELEQIVQDANIRLTKMTNNQYNLTLEHGEFYIVDRFRSGESRTTDTLSGGETFMVSLALALAISKKVQMKSRGIIEFFFLDEGFGSLDSKSLDVVIDTIETLQKENFKIGIITHVQELQDLIEKKIIVVKTSDEGSKILYQ